VVFDLQRVPVESLRWLSESNWIAFNAQFEWQHMTAAGFQIPLLHDAMLLDRLVSHRLRKLQDSAADVLGWELDKALQKSDWTGPLSAEQIEYAAADALAAVRIGHELLPRVEQTGQDRLYRLWRDVSPVLAQLSQRGHCINWAEHETLQKQWTAEQTLLKENLRKILGELNPNSGPQLGQWLTDNLPNEQIIKWPRTNTGRLKTNADTLALFADVVGVQALLRYKAVTKLIGTYGKGYAKHRHPITDRLHPGYSIGFTLTGRVSASKPNTQNPPRLADFRQLFIPAQGMQMIGADFSQIELRIAALLSRDHAMLEAYADGLDLHRLTAAAVSQTKPDEVTTQQRQAAKAINFGNLFGQRGRGLAATALKNYGVEMTEAEAEQALARFDGAYPTLAGWKLRQVNQAKQHGQVRTRLGLIRDFEVQGHGYLAGEATNVPVQGSAAEVLLESLARLPEYLKPSGAVLSHNVHDEICIEAPVEAANAAASALGQAMRDGMLAVFPEAEKLGLAGADLIELKHGNNWAEVH
jgi:DNA polymerase-1